MSYTWEATYRDGTIVKQHVEGQEISSEQIDRLKVGQISIKNGDVDIFTLHIDEGKKLIYRRRTEMNSGGYVSVCHVVGWRQKIHDVYVQSIIYCFEDGKIEVAGDFIENHPWFYAPKLREFEQ